MVGVVPGLTVRLNFTELTKVDSARSHHKLADPLIVIEFGIRGLRREPLVIVVVSIQDDLDPVLVHHLEQGRDLYIVTVITA